MKESKRSREGPIKSDVPAGSLVPRSQLLLGFLRSRPFIGRSSSAFGFCQTMSATLFSACPPSSVPIRVVTVPIVVVKHAIGSRRSVSQGYAFLSSISRAVCLFIRKANSICKICGTLIASERADL